MCTDLAVLAVLLRNNLQFTQTSDCRTSPCQVYPGRVWGSFFSFLIPDSSFPDQVNQGHVWQQVWLCSCATALGAQGSIPAEPPTPVRGRPPLGPAARRAWRAVRRAEQQEGNSGGFPSNGSGGGGEGA